MAGIVPPCQECITMQEVDVVALALVLEVLIGVVDICVLIAVAVMPVQDRAHDDVGFRSKRLDALKAEMWAAVWS